MMATLQGFPEDWYFGKRKTLSCRMIGNAFPPPVAKAVGLEIIKTLDHGIINLSSKKELSQTFA
jgi:DNA (cytosine-5)-methyltransferase 1